MPVDIGRSIRILRLAKGLQVKEVAAAASISNPYLTLVESGERSPSLAVIRRIAQALGVPSEALILVSQPAGSTIRTSSDRTEKIIDSITRLDEAEARLRRQLEGGADGADALQGFDA